MATKSKRERFEEVAGHRVQMVLDNLENLSKCANKRNYDFNSADIDKLVRALNEKLKTLKMKFDSELDEKKERKTFKF